MARRSRPQTTSRSEKWLRLVIEKDPDFLNSYINENTKWLSPLKEDEYAEYYDEDFLEKLSIDYKNLLLPLQNFWPKGGPRWDALGQTEGGKKILVEAKAYIEEAVDYKSRSENPVSVELIKKTLQEAKQFYNAGDDGLWNSPFYQYANRLAHLYYLNYCNKIDAYLVFLYFLNAPDVPSPCNENEWRGAIRIIKKTLGLAKEFNLKNKIIEVFYDVHKLC